jgi:hypothetical protein
MQVPPLRFGFIEVEGRHHENDVVLEGGPGAETSQEAVEAIPQ